MGKREDVKKPRMDRDLYQTIDPNAIQPLIRFIRGLRYVEPCCGQGHLVDQLADIATCVWESDIEPLAGQKQIDALDLTKHQINLSMADCIITNPPYKRDLLIPMMVHFTSLLPTWLLLPADLMHNQYFGVWMKNCQKVVSVGRLYWFPDEKTGKYVRGVDNFCWYFFPKGGWDGETVFYGR